MLTKKPGTFQFPIWPDARHRPKQKKMMVLLVGWYISIEDPTPVRTAPRALIRWPILLGRHAHRMRLISQHEVAILNQGDLFGPPVVRSELPGHFDAGGPRSADDNGPGGGYLGLQLVQCRESLGVGSHRLEGQVVEDAGPNGDDQLVVGDLSHVLAIAQLGLAAVAQADGDGVGLGLDALGGRDDELEGGGRVLGEGRGDGDEELLVGEGVWDDAARGGNVPEEVGVWGDEDDPQLGDLGADLLEELVGEGDAGPPRAENDDGPCFVLHNYSMARGEGGS
ncbi:unnamed protein product [Clonostachys rosea]|uniref:Uncharacterized protein n=1 Tax=Bionectria ochroleuca TaxID=29856 RepID=A0ABY6USY1_BIOOC|nr:unnamed protein product [Clonostachys rosea]